MASTGNPKNHNPEGLGNLAQIIAGHACIQCPNCGCNPNSYTGLDYDLQYFAYCPECGTREIGNRTKIRGTEQNPLPWVIVENAGTDNENLVIDFDTFREACNYIDRNYTDDDCPADIMRRRDDGVLTTEF